MFSFNFRASIETGRFAPQHNMSREVLRYLYRPLPYKPLSRSFSTTRRNLDSKNDAPTPPSLTTSPQSAARAKPAPSSTGKLSDDILKARDDGMKGLFSSILSDFKSSSTRPSIPIKVAPSSSSEAGSRFGPVDAFSQEPFHLHVYCHKHNTHITLTRPNRDAIISVSAGNIGFKKAQRGSYDAGFQLMAYVCKMIQERGLLMQGNKDYITSLEIVLRSWGKGREAFLSALKGVEGSRLRPRIIRISDNTRIKFGGTRGANPRRLG
jgi:small subunit ribosomal protein S11